jgi:hypothetical protein
MWLPKARVTGQPLLDSYLWVKISAKTDRRRA